MQKIGEIQLIQIQRESLKVTRDEKRYYVPDALLQVSKLQINRQGVMGILSDGNRLLDVHHELHPNSRNRSDNFLSIGFTSHYARMRERFGEHLQTGIAGENIIVHSETMITPEQAGSTFIIKTSTEETITLVDVIPAPPCAPFSEFCAGDNVSAAEKKATLQFLSNGIRGFYMRPATDTPMLIQAGDVLYISDN